MGRLAWALLLLLLLPPSRGLSRSSCQSGTYRDTSGKCLQCRVCDRNYAYREKCTETADAVCECAAGYSCGKDCEACECPLGQQRTPQAPKLNETAHKQPFLAKGRNGCCGPWTHPEVKTYLCIYQGCQNCPEQTFNDQRTGGCHPWRKCPDDKIWKPGTKERDVICWSGSESLTTQSSTSLSIFSTKMSEPGSQLIPVSIALVMVLLLSAVCVLFVCIFFQSWIQGKFLKPLHGQLAQEVDDCTYRYPEEEQGGSCEAAASLKGQLLEKIYSEDM